MLEYEFAAHAEACALDSLRVLVAQSQTIHRELIKFQLRQAGVTALRDANNGVDALNLLRAETFDLLIIDLALPQMDGIQLLEHVAALRADMRVLVVGGADAALLRATRRLATMCELRIHDCVSHPLPDDLLVEVLSATVEDAAARGARDAMPWERARLPLSLPGSTAALQSVDMAAMLAMDCLSVSYQPRMSLLTHGLTGVDVRAHLQHPALGLIAADRLMSLACEQGLATTLAHRSLACAAADQAAWADDGCQTPVSVKIPTGLVEASRSVDRLIDIVRSAGSRPDAIQLEVTAASPILDAGAFYRGAASLRMAGFGLAIGDIGMGHRSLDLLANGPFTAVIIDSSPVSGAAACRGSREVMECCARIGSRLGMTVTAKGVASPVDLAHAAIAGCDDVQGGLISDAVRAQAVPGLSRQRLW